MPPVSTPCVNVCVIDTPSGLCAGCGRTLAEIGNWAMMSENDRKATMKLLATRLRALGTRRGNVEGSS